MKYWPLTAVLLAFWLGRETSAEKDAPRVGKFDRIEVTDQDGDMVLITSEGIAITSKSGHTCALKSGSAHLRSKDGTGVLIEPGYVAALGPEKDGKQRRRALLDARGDTAKVEATLGRHGVRLWSAPRSSIVSAIAEDRSYVTLSASPDTSVNVIVHDNDGAEAVLGQTWRQSKKTGASTGLPASTLTLRSKNRTILTQLPR
jgi:hypothetical protein